MHSTCNLGPWGNDPLSTVAEAIGSVFGWMLVIAATSLVGMWLGVATSTGQFLGIGETLFAWLFCTIFFFVHPWFCLTLGISLVAWYLPNRIDDGRLRLAAAVVNLLTWWVVVVVVAR